MADRDVVVVGASAGGIQAVSEILLGLPPTFPAAVLVVLHLSPGTRSTLPEVLQRRSALPVASPVDGAPILPGRVYVAPADVHMLVDGEHVVLRRSARENRTRPAVDPLFRSAAAAYRERVIGVVLSGALYDGAAGLLAIRRCGGMTVVQDPEDARHPAMPRAAILAAEPDHVLPVADIAALLIEATRPNGGRRPPPVPPEIAAEAEFSLRPSEVKLAAKAIELTCPDCGGNLTDRQTGKLRVYRCHTGHAFYASELAKAQTSSTERALWSAVRMQRERAQLYRQMAGDAKVDGRETTSHRWTEEAVQYERDANTLLELILKDRTPIE